MTDRPDAMADRPGTMARLAGVGAILAAILWPIALGDLAATVALAIADGGVAIGMGPIVPLALALLLFCAAVAALERQATKEIGLADLVGALTIGTATVLVVATLVLGSFVLLGPGLVLLFVGSVIFGAAGFDGKRRPRWGSALVGIGAGGLLAYLLLAAVPGFGRLEDVAGTALVCLLLYSVGWGMLGLHLVLARPLVAPSDGSPQGR